MGSSVAKVESLFGSALAVCFASCFGDLLSHLEILSVLGR